MTTKLKQKTKVINKTLIFFTILNINITKVNHVQYILTRCQPEADLLINILLE